MSKDTLKFLFCHIAVFALIVAIVFFAFALSTNNVAHADYEDLTSDTLVNFNQLAFPIVRSSWGGGLSFASTSNGITIGGSVTYNSSFVGFSETDISTITGHIYFIRYLSNDSSIRKAVKFNGNTLNSIYDDYYNVFTSVGSGVNLGIFAQTTANYNSFLAKPILIDLTMMFGSSFEPDLQQCKDYFTSDYYMYNSGTTMPFSISYLDGYNKAYSDISQSMQLTLDMSALGFNTTAQNILGYNNSLFYYDIDNYMWIMRGAIGVPLNTLLEVNTTITINISFYGYEFDSTNYYAYVATKVDDTIVPLVNFPMNRNTNGVTQSFTFSLPYATSYLYYYFWDTSTSQIYSTALFVPEFSIKSYNVDLQSLAKNSYNSGYAEAKEEAQVELDRYKRNGDLYNNIYNLGKADGIEQANEYNFGGLMTAVVEAPLNAVLSMFDFEFLGYNLKDFVTVIFTLCVIVTIVRMIMGG